MMTTAEVLKKMEKEAWNKGLMGDESVTIELSLDKEDFNGLRFLSGFKSNWL